MQLHIRLHKFGLGPNPQKRRLRLITWQLLAARNTKIFCSKLGLQFNNAEAFTDEQIQKRIRYYSFLEKNGYVTKDPDGVSGSLTGNVTHKFSPTEKLWALADRRDGDCFFYKSAVRSNIKVTQEEKHDRYKQVTVVYVTYTVNLSNFEKVNGAAWGIPTSTDRRARFVLINDPFTSKPRIAALDYGDAAGWWSGNKMPDAIAALNMMGPQALEQMKP